MSVFEAILCRGCALSSNENKPLFYKSSSEAVPHPTDVAEMLEEFLPFKIQFGDGYPSTICVHCEHQLKTFAMFKSSVLRIHRHFTRRLERYHQSGMDSNRGANSTDIHESLGIHFPIDPKVVKDPSREPELPFEDTFDIDGDPLEMKSEAHGELISLDIQKESMDGWATDLADKSNDLMETFQNKTGNNAQQMDTKKFHHIHIKVEDELLIKDCTTTNDSDVVDNRRSLPVTIKTKNGIRCSFCMRAFRYGMLFEMHLCTLGKTAKYKCTDCDESLKYAEITAHKCSTTAEFQKQQHNNIPKRNRFESKKPHEMLTEEECIIQGDVVDNRLSIKWENGSRCSFCMRKFNNRNYFEMHLCTKSGLAVFQCTTCDERLNYPQVGNHIDRIPNCSDDAYLSKLQYLLEMSDEEVHLEDGVFVDNRYSIPKAVKIPGGLRCSFCRNSFITRSFYDMHLCQSGGSPSFQCTICEKRLSSVELRAHLYQITSCSMDEKDESMFDNKQLINRNAFPESMETSDRELKHKIQGLMKFKKEQCPVCQVRFSSEIALKHHICSTDRKRRRYKCDICDKVIQTNHGIKEHMIRHTGIRSFKCDECPKMFKLNSDLYVHRQMHLGNLHRFICDVCGHACRNKSHLESHSLTHTKERPIKCDHCDKSFKSTKIFYKHFMSVHSSHRPHVCHICGASFGVKHRMQRHVRNHGTIIEQHPVDGEKERDGEF